LAVRHAEPGPANSLYVLAGEWRWSGGALAASEPLDDGSGWREVKPGMLVRAEAGAIAQEQLDLAARKGSRR
jgi:hypothetical protein